MFCRKIVHLLVAAGVVCLIPPWAAGDVVLASWAFADPTPSTDADYGPDAVYGSVSCSVIRVASEVGEDQPGFDKRSVYGDTSSTITSTVAHTATGCAGFVPVVGGSGASGGGFLSLQPAMDEADSIANAISEDLFIRRQLVA